MTRVLALVPDLLFGSRVEGTLGLAGHDVRLLADERELESELPGAAVLIVDLTGEMDGAALLRELSGGGLLAGVRTIGFYAHVDAAARDRAVEAGFDLVVPRSRMAREGAQLVAGLFGS